MSTTLVTAAALVFGLACAPATSPGSGDGGAGDGGDGDGGTGNGGAGDGGGDGGADSGAPCTPETASFVDWMAPGTFAAGRRIYKGTTSLRGRDMPHVVQTTYPAVADGSDTALAAGGPFPLILFEHAYGADYLNSDWLLDRLATRGFIVLSAGHNGAWDSAGDWWNDHAALFVDTHALVAGWNADPDSDFFGAVDMDTMALMGHSHGGGAALHVMDQLDPDAVVLITVRPNLDGALTRYHEVYDGMPPMLNVAASRDEDSTTAYGTSLAVYEALTRPRFMVTVEGASHYTFTDEASVAPSNIEREAGQVSGGSAIVAFLEYLLHGDQRGLQSLRGDVALFGDDGAPSRNQSHPLGARVIDDFEPDSTREGTAIAGISGQTYVNGFLGDTFAVYEDGVALLMAEIEALSDPGDRVLFYQDASRSTDAYAEALARLDRDVTSISSDEDFATALTDPWDLVVATQQDGNTTDSRPFDSALAAWICGGGKAILSDFRYRSTTAAKTFACAGAFFDGTTNWTTMTSDAGLFEGELRVQNPGWGVFSYGLLTDHTVFATNETTVSGVPDPDLGPLGPVQSSGLRTFEEVSALDSSRALMLPTNALELAWSRKDGDAAPTVHWSLDVPIDATELEALALRMLQVHDDPLNPIDGDLTLTLQVQDAAGGSASFPLSVGPTMDWLESTVPKSVFETRRVSLFDIAGFDRSQVTGVSLIFDGSASGRILVDDLELTPGLGCVDG